MSTSWQVGGCDVEILCEDQALGIEVLNGVYYAVIPNGASWFPKMVTEKDPYGEEFTQEYRYTPFQVRVKRSATCSRTTPIDVMLYLDGEHAGGYVVTPDIPSATFKGFNTSAGVEQFCFSPPRVGALTTSINQPKLELGSIRVEMSEAVFQRYDDNFYEAVTDNFTGSTKKDAVNAGMGENLSQGFAAIQKGKLVNHRMGGRSTKVYGRVGGPFTKGKAKAGGGGQDEERQTARKKKRASAREEAAAAGVIEDL